MQGIYHVPVSHKLRPPDQNDLPEDQKPSSDRLSQN